MDVFGLGERKYNVESKWIKLPEGKSFYDVSDVLSVSVGSNDLIYVLQRADPYIQIFSLDGNLVNEWSDKTMTDGHYIRSTLDRRLFVVDRNHHRIVIIDEQGQVIQTIGDSQNPGLLGEPFNHPTDVAFADNGDIYVSDGYGNSHVHHFNSNGEFIKSWGNPGNGKGEFLTPHSILIDDHNQVLVADRDNNRVQFFNLNGEYISEIRNFFHPMKIFKDNNGFIYITDQTPSLSLFSPDGTFIGKFKTLGLYGHGVTVDKYGNIYVAEQFVDRIIKFVLQ